MGNEKVLCYKDSVIRTSDLDILRGPCYLNDEIIAFYFHYLSSLFDPLHEVLLVPPSLSFLLANIESCEDAKENIEPLSLSDTKIVIFPVNNNDDSETGDSGTHWSLLVYYRDMNTFIHHDSMQGFNNESATRLYDAVKGFLNSSSSSKAKKLNNNQKKRAPPALTKPTKACPSLPSFTEYETTPQQSNGYDCGLYVLAIARTICQWSASKSRGKDVDWFSEMEKQVNESTVEMAMRTEVMKVIEGLRVSN